MGEDRMRVRLDLAYDGTAFSGWAAQPGLRTVQGVLEAALAIASRAEGDPPRLTVAGRTDAGVHATGQVAHVDLAPAEAAALAGRRGGIDAIAARLTGMTDGDVVVHRSSLAPAGFDARFSASFRRYRYRIADSLPLQDPLQRGRTLHHPRRLDDGAIAEAFADVAGLHDFAAFCKPRPGATTIRDLRSFTWRREEGVLVAEVLADAFCHNMVRALVGAGLAVGGGRLQPARIGELLAATARSNEFALAPPHGLTLVEVGYPPDEGLAAQADRARARRA
ncbi:tRNA pseudouridine synthase A [Amnibacterium endophyticum]|uniref:tRNA pseudouridine synthase A n=1 Tax=Amnibacterium endophyticum TaxID=2109337 RepID=A0ABW4LCS3_9MICO